MSISDKSDFQAICSSLGMLLEPKSVFELRVPNTTRGTVSGYFDHADLLARSAYEASGTAPGVYVTLNPVSPDLLARAANRSVPYAKHTTSDSDIVCRRWLPIDFDPVRPAGISATNAEHEAALDRARQCRDFLCQKGWPTPVYADSGNGAHLLFKVELPNDKLTTELIRQFLSALSLQFTDKRVAVDVGTFNAARIWKLYGTVAAKGDETPERPHRLARMLESPSEVVIVTPDQIGELAALNVETSSIAIRKNESRFEVGSWIHKNNLPVVREGDWQGGRKWILNPCPFNSEHTNESAYIVQFANGAIAAGCHHNGCSSENWQTLKHLYPGEDGAGLVSAANNQKSQVDQLMEFANAWEYFHTRNGEAYATIHLKGHFETWPVRSKNFQQLLLSRYYVEFGKAVPAKALSEAVALCEAKAQFEGNEVKVFTRLAEYNGKIYLDLADEEWTILEIDTEGWRVAVNPIAKFRRSRGMEALPLPVAGGSIEELRPFINTANESDWKLLIAWLVGALRPQGPYPILVLHGEQGSAKSTTARILRSLIDPNVADLRSEPRGVQDLMLAANNGWIVSLDNLSSLSGTLSDALCRVATGGGYGTRELFSDKDEVLIEVQRPCIINGIEELATRPDLLDRALIVYLPAIPDSSRRPERDLWNDFRAAQGRIMGALLAATSAALARLPNINLPALPRLADFVSWVSAAERDLGWPDGAFVKGYMLNRTSANDLALDGSLVAQSIRQLCSDCWQWKGTATELLSFLNSQIGELTQRQRSWPTSANALSNALRRSTPNLRKIGISVEFLRDTTVDRRRIISISRMNADKAESNIADAATDAERIVLVFPSTPPPTLQ